MKLIKTLNTIYNTIYIYQINNKLVAFKPSKNVEKELLANKLVSLLNINILNLKPFTIKNKIENKIGLLMDYLKDSTLLTHYKKRLNENQLKQLKKIILFDIWVGNKDRHTANIFVNNSDLIAFDHEKIFQKGKARNFIKLDIGRKLNKSYVTLLENSLTRNLTITATLKKLNFTKEDFLNLLNIKDADIKKITRDPNLTHFLISRKNLSALKF